MRLRLRNAVQALLADPSIAELKDAPKLAAVVLYAKSRAPKGEEDDLQTSIWGAELGRWMGMKESTVHHKVLPVLRGSDAVHTQVVRDGKGHPTGLDCLVMPLWRAHHGGGAGRHPLALTQVELATLLHLCEALFGHGWTPKDKEPTPPGLLAGRTGKGAATDRLGLLLMLLNTRASGWLQLVGGSVKKREGRGAATLARLLGCSPSGARKVLARLTEAGVVARQRKATSTRMNGRGRVMLLPVARAYGRGLASVEAVSGAGSVFSARPDGACGDLGPAGTVGALGAPGIGGAEDVGDSVIQERPDGAEFHADHASVVTAVVPQQLSCGFSGEGRGGQGRRPERACTGEDQPDVGDDAAAGSPSPVVEGGPLRGEKQNKSLVDERVGQRAAGAGAGGRSKAGWEKAQQRRRVALPADLRLRVVLGPVSWLWERLSGWQQDQVEAAAKAELAHLAGLGVAREGAPRLLADRLADRLVETGGEAMVTGPYGWLIRRGLPQRPACSHRKCDDGVRLDTGEDCENCGNVIHLRRAWRTRIGADIDRELPGLADDERRRVLEGRLRERTAIEADDLARRQEHARAERARRDAARAAAAEQAKRERLAAAAADAVRQALACEDCGRDRASGLCEACDHRRQTEVLIGEAGLLAAAAAADLSDAGSIAAAVAGARTAIGDSTAAAWQEFLEITDVSALEADPQTAADAYAFTAFQAAHQAVAAYQDHAVAVLGSAQEAEAEARHAYRSEQGRPWFQHNPTGADAVAAATKAADTARKRVAEYLLAARLEQLRERSAARPETRARWADRLPGLAARPLHGDVTGAVIA
ncbi:hypothetical protein ACFWH1_08755 [Streptomyces sp. NPDC127037]|uniref:hypothetical protein n=1 Tax=Streptomyces sp. NPDC127037 TaxID=3347113 RepID=UPI003667C876